MRSLYVEGLLEEKETDRETVRGRDTQRECSLEVMSLKIKELVYDHTAGKMTKLDSNQGTSDFKILPFPLCHIFLILL